MISESLTVTLNLSGYHSNLALPSSLRLGDVVLWEWIVSELSGFCVFLEDDRTDSMDLREFFSGFRMKYLIVTTCVEKQCQPCLSYM